MTEEKDKSFNPAYRSLYFNLFRSPNFMLSIMLGYLGMALILIPIMELPFDFPFLLQRWGFPFAGTLLLIVSISFFMSDMRKRRLLRDERFIDVDARGRYVSADDSLQPILRELRELKGTQHSVDYDRIAKLVEESRRSSAQRDDEALKSFIAYFDSIRKVLEHKANIADEKASILLDKGTGYSKLGIIFFIFSIVGWQFLSWIHGFQVQFIYGIASCSVLFVFIEFLSAWFLKQYRHFVDTSTYLIKVKSIFDRFMLAYLAAGDFDQTDEKKNKPYASVVLELLSDEIKWPDSYLQKSADVSFARETMEALTDLVKVLKAQSKTKAKSVEQDG